jgi:TetR/AcrR family transcriptional regulator
MKSPPAKSTKSAKPTEAMSTEERLLKAARRVFLEKGYDGTTSRDLAEASGLNVAMTNYYFRSKAQLFQRTFADLHGQFFEKMDQLIARDIPLREKVLLLIETEYEQAQAYPGLPMFVMYEFEHNPDLFLNLGPTTPALDSLLYQQVREAIARGEMRAINPVQIILLITANVQHPYMAHRIMSKAFNMTEADFAVVLEQHKQTVKDMIMSYLFGPEKKS